MNARRLALAAFPICLVVVYACSSDSDDGSAGIVLDAGPTTLLDGTTSVPVSDGSTPPNDDSGAADTGSPVVAKGPITTCTPIAAFSTRKASPFGTGGSFNGKYLFTYGLPFNASSDGNSHLLGRYFDGTTLGSEIDFGTDGQTFGFSSVDPTSGMEYFVHVRGGGVLSRVAFDLTTGKFAVSDDSAFGGFGENFAVGAFPGGALAVFGSQSPQGAYVTRSYSDGGWEDDASVDGGLHSESKNITAAGVALSKAGGKGAAWWIEPNAGSNDTLVVLPYDGAKYGTVVRRAFAQNEELFSSAALSNGDVVFAWLVPSTGTSLAIFHPSTGQWDADIVLGGSAPGTGGPVVLVDANDTITALFVNPQGYAVRRRIGGTWTADIPTNQTVYFANGALDPSGNVVIIAASGGGSLVTRMSPEATSVGPFVSTGFGSSNVSPIVAFDPAGDPVLVGPSKTADLMVYTTTCSTQ